MAEKPIEEVKEHPEFHSCLTPRGLLWYDVGILTAFQQKQLNEHKFDVIKEDCKYLAAHPEIRAIVAIFLRQVFRKLPITISIAQFARQFFSRRPDILQNEINNYMKEKGEPIKREGDSAVVIHSGSEPSIHLVDDFFQPPYYYYLSYTEESSEKEEEMDSDKSYSYTTRYSSYSRSTSAESATKYAEFNKKYSLLVSSRASTRAEPTLLRVTPAGSTGAETDVANSIYTVEFENEFEDDFLKEIEDATIDLTKQAIQDANENI